jgi:hypothetical protein
MAWSPCVLVVAWVPQRFLRIYKISLLVTWSYMTFDF